MNSFNHYSLGSVGEWLFQTVAGLDTSPDAVGFAELALRPVPGGTLTSARASIMTPHGPAASAWSLDGPCLTLDLQVPVNTRARLTLPAGHRAPVQEEGQEFAGRPGVSALGGGEYLLGSGHYRLRALGDRPTALREVDRERSPLQLDVH